MLCQSLYKAKAGITDGKVAFLPCGALHPVETGETRLWSSERKRDSHLQLLGDEYP